MQSREKTSEIVDKVITVGCFDLFHDGHKHLIKCMRKVGRHVIVGVHDSRTYFQLKNKFPIDNITKRMLNVKQYADQVFCVTELDAFAFIQCMIDMNGAETACYLRGDDGPKFPYRASLESIMAVRFIPRDPSGVSSTKLRAQLLYRQDTSTKGTTRRNSFDGS